MMHIFIGILLCLLSFLMGVWTKTNVYERHSLVKVFLSFLIFAPIGLLFGIGMALLWGVDGAFGIIPVAVGSIFSDKIEETLRRSLRMGDGPTEKYFMELADQDGVEVSRQFQINATKIKLENDKSKKITTVDDLIAAYNSARVQFNLEPVKDIEKNIPYV